MVGAATTPSAELPVILVRRSQVDSGLHKDARGQKVSKYKCSYVNRNVTVEFEKHWIMEKHRKLKS